MGGIAHGVVEAALTHVAGVAVDGVAMGGVVADRVRSASWIWNSKIWFEPKIPRLSGMEMVRFLE